MSSSFYIGGILFENGDAIAPSALPIASTSQGGIVQLSNATDSTSSAVAATASAVKTVNDIAVNAQATANTALTTADSALAAAVWTESAGVISPAVENSVVAIEVPMGIDGLMVAETPLGVKSLIAPAHALFLDNDHSIAVDGFNSKITHVINTTSGVIPGIAAINEIGDLHSYNMEIGELLINGDPGQVGYVLTSAGEGSSPVWAAAGGGGGGGTVTSITAGSGLTGGTITDSGTIALDTTCVLEPTLFTAKGDLLSASDVSTPVALPVGVDGQVLTACSECATGLTWAAGGGGGGGSPATPTTPGLVAGCTEASDGNTALGYNSLLSLSGGYNNTALGRGALECLVDNGDNVAIGETALQFTTGSENTAIGSMAGQCIETGFMNVAIGCAALQCSTDACCNVAIGQQALRRGSQNYCNIVVGARAGRNLNGLDNVIIGHQAVCLVEDACYNVVIGACTGLGQIAGNCYNVIIGHCADPGDVSCCLYIGTAATSYWIKGNSDRSLVPGAGIVDSNGSVGVCNQSLMTTGNNDILWADGLKRVAAPATSADAGQVGDVAITTGFFYWHDGTQWLRTSGSTF